MSTRSSRSWLIAVSCAVIALSVAPSALLAHPRLKRSTPSAGDHLVVSPSQLRLWFTEAPELAMTTVVLTDSAGKRIPIGSVERDTDVVAVRANILRSLGAGRYTVTWRTAASDGHLMRGSFSFNVLGSAAAIGSTDRLKGVARPVSQPPTSGKNSASLEPTIDNALQPSSVAVRAVTFVCLLVIIGVVVFRFGVLDRGIR